MAKVLLLIVIAAIVVAWFRARAREVGSDLGGKPEPKAARPVAPEAMVSCAHCKVHLPASEAVFDAAGTAYCGAPHLEAARMQARR